MRRNNLIGLCFVFFTVVLLAVHPVQAEEIIKIGLTVPLSGSGAVWGQGTEFMLKQAAQEVKEAGGVKVKGKIYNFEAVAYDNKYTAAEGTKVAQTLINRDGVKFIGGVGTAPTLAAQSLTERAGLLCFPTSWGKKMKGPEAPMSFFLQNSPREIYPGMVKFLRQTFPEAKTMVLLNPNDATGRDVEEISRPMYEKAGFKVLTSDFYERGTTEFQPIANRLASFKPDIVDLEVTTPPDAGMVFKHLDVLGFNGVKVSSAGGSVKGLVSTGGSAVNGVYFGIGLAFDGPTITEHQRKLNAACLKHLNRDLVPVWVCFYDLVYILKTAMEKAQSIDPKDVAAVLPSVEWPTFYGGKSYFGAKEVYGSKCQAINPVFITQAADGIARLVKLMDPRKN